MYLNEDKKLAAVGDQHTWSIQIEKRKYDENTCICVEKPFRGAGNKNESCHQHPRFTPRM